MQLSSASQAHKGVACLSEIPGLVLQDKSILRRAEYPRRILTAESIKGDASARLVAIAGFSMPPETIPAVGTGTCQIRRTNIASLHGQAPELTHLLASEATTNNLE
jgi:hypothetical protein